MGDATGCAHLAMLFDSLFARPGAEKDDLQAYQYYERACALGSAKGCFGQDGFNQPGFDSLDIVGHNVQALAYFTEGCELGYPEDCYNLGALYLGAWKHPGLSYDRAKAREAWQRACALGVDQACE